MSEGKHLSTVRSRLVYLTMIMLIVAVIFEAFYMHDQMSLIVKQRDAFQAMDSEADNLSKKIVAIRKDLSEVLSNMQSLQEQINELQSNRIELQKEIDNLEKLVKQKEGLKPSYDEFHNWLVNDKTDRRKYEEYAFDCDDFAAMLIEHGEEKGWDMALVYIMEEDVSAHCFCAIELEDRGSVWVEPQEDTIFEPKKVGDSYLPGYGIEKIDYILVIW